MTDCYRSRFAVAGFTLSNGANRATDLREEFASRAWNREAVVEWDPVRRLMTVEFELDLAESDVREPVVLVQYRELIDCLRRGRPVPSSISIEILDSWIVERRRDRLPQAA